MDEWVERYREDVQRALDAGVLRTIDFAGPTYQVEIYDPVSQETCWPFLQFDEHGALKDAFCSCPCETNDCLHLAIAIDGIVQETGYPLHLRFEHVFWNQLCKLLGSHSGFEERFIKKKAEGRYLYQNEVFFEVKAKTAGAQKNLNAYIEKRVRETPETSIKFSNLNQEEIDHWREGRPSPTLRYTLSLWFDLAKWMMRLSEEATLSFEEDNNGFPTKITAEFSTFTIYCELSQEDLIKLIPSIETVNSTLRVVKAAEEKLTKITFDPKMIQFTLEHESKSKNMHEPRGGDVRKLGNWTYVPNIGFYPINGSSFLSRARITKDEISGFMEQYSTLVSHYIPVHDKPETLSYTLYFDAEWYLHLRAFLFEKTDLLGSRSAFVGNWVYLHDKGFFPVAEVVFNTVETVLAPSQISHFVNHHRIWLNGQEGFQTHLASIESHLAYSVTGKNTLLFHTKAQTG